MLLFVQGAPSLFWRFRMGTDASIRLSPASQSMCNRSKEIAEFALSRMSALGRKRTSS